MFEKRKNELKNLLKISEKEQRFLQIEEMMKKSDFWLDHEKAAKISQEYKHLEELLLKFETAEDELELEQLASEAAYSQSYDDANCYLSIHAGSGGTEAMDWAGMLLRMYLRYLEKSNYKIEILDQNNGEEAGIKSVLIKIKGFRSYGRLKGESGVHRLVRMSPFDADKARHTSFALVELVPELDKPDTIIKPEDLKIDVFRAGGHGGQGVNTTDSAVRITHLPTSIVVVCQNERSQNQNKEQALKVLSSRLQIIEEQKQLDEKKKLIGETVSASWGNQIRSYVLAPYQLVKDLRTGYETSNTSAILNGNIDPLLDSYNRFLIEHHS